MGVLLRSVAAISSLVVLALGAGCEKFGVGENRGPSSVPSDGGDASSSSGDDAQAPPNGDAAPPSICEGVRGADQPCDVRCNNGARCVSCKQILAERKGAPDGVYAVQKRNNPDTPLSVYCDMTSFEGGWLLVGRSVEDSSTNRIGWKIGQGNLFNDDVVYSLDTQELAFDPGEMIFGSRRDGKTWGPNVYRTTLPASFVVSYGASALYIQPTRTAIKGSCAGGSLQLFIGHTNRTENFFFRDNGGAEKFGLRSDGWETNSDESCTGGGLLSAEQGMIFVR